MPKHKQFVFGEESAKNRDSNGLSVFIQNYDSKHNKQSVIKTIQNDVLFKSLKLKEKVIRAPSQQSSKRHLYSDYLRKRLGSPLAKTVQSYIDGIGTEESLAMHKTQLLGILTARNADCFSILKYLTPSGAK